VLLDADPAITEFSFRPASARWSSDGAIHESHFDFLVTRHWRRELWHMVDDAAIVDSPSMQVLRSSLGQLGYGLVLTTWRDLLNPAALETATRIRGNAWQQVDLATREAIRSAIAENTSIPWSEVIAEKHWALREGAISRLIFEGVLLLLPSGRIRPDSTVSLNSSHPGTGDSHGHI
jgi:hypothetical protein